MRKVVHLITALGTGGGETMLMKLVSHMDRSRFSNVVVSLTSRGELGTRIAKLGVPVIALEMVPGVPGVGGMRRLVTLLRDERPSILQTWFYHADLLGLVAAKLAGVSRVAWNVRCAELDRRDHPLHLWITLGILARMSPLPAVVVANSTAGRLASARRGYRPRRWEVIPNGFELDVFRPSDEARAALRSELGLKSDTPLVGLIARFDPMKDHPTFLQAARRLRDSRADVHFVLAGNGIDRGNVALVAEIGRLGLDDRVHLLGERRDIPVVTAALDVASCCSYSEGFPNVIGEAMACGVPCVATDVGDCIEIVGGAGVVVPRRNADAMARGWADILETPHEDRRALGMKGRERVASLFSIEAVARRYESLYDGLG